MTDENIILEKIDDKIPDYFYPAMAGELCSIFGLSIFRKIPMDDIDDDGNRRINWEKYYYDLHAGTGGWVEALCATCKKLDMEWFSDYWLKLEWYDSDILDTILEDRIVKNFIDNKGQTVTSYYRYLSNPIIID